MIYAYGKFKGARSRGARMEGEREKERGRERKREREMKKTEREEGRVKASNTAASPHQPTLLSATSSHSDHSSSVHEATSPL